ncbi:hypothetical protein [Celeribacter sp.]|uniref:glycine-rich domain-containing protein n=1 Tax=Celeribacter sp. TaxID=1890673 RepID=UPI003A948968
MTRGLSKFGAQTSQTRLEELLGERGSGDNAAVRFKDLAAQIEKLNTIAKAFAKVAEEIAQEADDKADDALQGIDDHDDLLADLEVSLAEAHTEATNALAAAVSVTNLHNQLVADFPYTLVEYQTWMEDNIAGMLPSDFANDATYFQSASTSVQSGADWSGAFDDDAQMSARVAVLGPSNTTIATKGTVEIDHNRVYEIHVRVRVSDDGTLGDMAHALGFNSWTLDGTLVNGNLQTTQSKINVASGVQDLRILVAGSNVDIPPENVDRVLSSDVAFLRPHYRANVGSSSDAICHVSRLAVSDVTGAKRVEYVEDTLSTSIGINSGQITNIMGLAVDEESAFGVLLEQLEVDAGGVSAVIEYQQSALVDLEGFATAFAGITVETENGGIAGFYATSYSDPDGSGGSALQLLGDHVIAEGTISTNKLVVGLGANLIANSDFSDGLQGWESTASGASGDNSEMTLRSAGSNWSGATYPVLQAQQQGDNQSGYFDIRYKPEIENGVVSRGVAVSPGEVIDASVRVSNHRCSSQIRIEWRDKNGAGLGYSTADTLADNQASTSSDNPHSWPVMWTMGEAPANAAFATIHLRKLPGEAASPDSFAFYTEPQISRTHAEASEPTPYSPQGSTLISGGKIKTNSIKASAIETSSFAAAGLSVFGGELKSDNYQQDDAGWRITHGGEAEFNNIAVRNWFKNGELLGSGLPIDIEIITESDAAFYFKQTGIVQIYALGAGGSGGLIKNINDYAHLASGGGAGGTSISILVLTDEDLLMPHVVTIGAGGVRPLDTSSNGANGPGNDGGDTSIVGALLNMGATGGEGGNYNRSSGTASVEAVNGGMGWGGDQNYQGGGCEEKTYSGGNDAILGAGGAVNFGIHGAVLDGKMNASGSWHLNDATYPMPGAMYGMAFPPIPFIGYDGATFIGQGAGATSPPVIGSGSSAADSGSSSGGHPGGNGMIAIIYFGEADLVS